MGKVWIHRTSNHFTVDGLEFFNSVTERNDLSWADKGAADKKNICKFKWLSLCSCQEYSNEENASKNGLLEWWQSWKRWEKPHFTHQVPTSQMLSNRQMQSTPGKRKSIPSAADTREVFDVGTCRCHRHNLRQRMLPFYSGSEPQKHPA